jgi:uncharacterized protein
MPEPQMEELDQDECRRLLAGRHLGRLAVPDFGGPMIFPVNDVVDEDLVVFEVDAIDEATRTGWSVVVRGILAEVTDPAHLERLRALPLYPWAPGRRSRYVRVRPLRPGRLLAVEGCVRYRRPQHRFTVDWIVQVELVPLPPASPAPA